MNKKLTEKERDVLERLQKGIPAHYMRSIGNFQPDAYWYMTDDHKKCTQQIKGLQKKEYIRVLSVGAFGQERIIKIMGEKPIPDKGTGEAIPLS